MFKRTLVAGFAGLAIFTMTACTQGNTTSTETETKTEETKTTQTTSEATEKMAEEEKAAAPAPFDKKGVKVAIVQNTGQGDYFQQYLNGTKKQAEALGIELSVYDAQGDNATQANQVEQAIAAGVKGLIVRHGFPDTLCPGVNKAIDAGIKVVIYDVEIQKCAPRAIQTQQSDQLMAGLVLDHMKADIGTDKPVGYVNVLGIAPLDRRDAVWKDYLKKEKWTQKFFTGKYTTSTATDTAPMVDTALKQNPDVVAVYAPYDELTKATLTALEQNPNLKGKVNVYGADISTADIQLMVKEGSPWRSTGATDPNAIGAAVVRTLALHMTDQLKETKVEFPPILITQDFLREKGIKNMDDLRKAEPKLNISETSSADWMPTVTF
ncbi:MAG: sugar ABC transporter substrate-binding protein [Actinomycetales bacterium]|nr:MAG: sugar ABC transporter substrate-binding protein [Actinomycetales bacterium]